MNILLIVCDTLRVDHLGCYGYFRETSPSIDNIARDGVVFEDIYNAGAPTGPAFTCIYTGLHTIRHKYYQFLQPGVREIDDTIFTMPELLSAGGYTTVAVDNLVDFQPHSKHWIRGYDFYINPNPRAFFPPAQLMARDVNKRLIPWIRKRPDEEFFLFVHYWDPHLPYTQPQEYREIFHHERGKLSDLKVAKAPAGYRYVPGWGKVGEFVDGEVVLPSYGGFAIRPITISIDLYDGEIRYMDNAIGEVMSVLESEGILEDTLIIVTSDHGENLGQHYSFIDSPTTKKWEHDSLHDAITHIPLIVRYPKTLPRGIRVEGFGQHIDLLPTILDIIRAPVEALDIDGKSLLPLLKGEIIRDTLFMEQSAMQRAVRTEGWKLIDDILKGTLELYDVENDPLETIDLIETEKGKAEALKVILDKWVKSNLKEGVKDPIVYEEMSRLSRMAIEYRGKISQLFDSFASAKERVGNRSRLDRVDY